MTSENQNPKGSRARLSAIDWRVYVILDPSKLPDNQSIVDTARQTLRVGAGVVQLRDKQATSGELVERGRRVGEVCREFDSLFVVNDRLDVALAAGADGVHLGPEDIAVADARRVAPDLVIGGSAGTVERARRLVEAGADYLGCGAVYEARSSKPDASAPRGPEMIADVVAAVDVPVVGIGGITADNAGAVIRAGASGVAVIRHVVAAEAPGEATRELLEAVESHR